jgi:ribonuclease G
MGENLIVINADFGETRVAIIENGIIVELLLERRSARSIVGNIYRGHITRVLPGMQAAFVDIGSDRSAFLHASDLVAADDELGDGGKKKRDRDEERLIQDLIQTGNALPVQVSKGPISTKGARVTAQLSLPGRHLVYMPQSSRGGVSRRIEDDKERERLAKIVRRINPSKGALIARTAAEGASADALASDADYLSETWADIHRRFSEKKKPGLLYEDLDLPLKVARDRLNDSVSELVIDDKGCFNRLKAFVDRLMPSRLDAVRYYSGEDPVFDAFGIEAEIKRALERRVTLPSGGSLIIDQAEALTAIDVNTGKFVGKGSKDMEETILTTNLEAVEEIAYQLRFRNIGGLVVLDLIDMDRPSSRRKVLSRIKELLEDDRAKASVKRISEFGLVEMTRQRTTDSLGRILHEPCDYCDGTGRVLSRETVANEALRDIRRRSHEFKADIELRVHPHVAEVFSGSGKAALKALEQRIRKKIILKIESKLHHEAFDIRAARRAEG